MAAPITALLSDTIAGMAGNSCTIIGAGIAGLAAARRLVEAGWVVQVIEKGAGVGGRVATRRVVKAVFDHGAQFFSIRDARFGDLILPLLSDGTARIWSEGFPTHDSNIKKSQTGELSVYPRYCGAAGMTAVPKRLAQGLTIRLGNMATTITRDRSKWQVALDNDEKFRSDVVILTPPLPQTLALLDASHIDLPTGDRRPLSSITYDPCLALLVTLDRPSLIKPPGAIQVNGDKLAWIADNNQKGISPVTSVTLHATPQFSRAMWDRNDAAIARQMAGAAQAWLGPSSLEYQVKRWLYSRPTSTHPADCLLVESSPPLILAGDAFGGPRIEGAALSGLAAADLLCS